MRHPNIADLQADIAALRAVTEIELKTLNIRMSAVESTQRELVRVATQGKTGLRVFMWLGAAAMAGSTAVAAFWTNLSGR